MRYGFEFLYCPICQRLLADDAFRWDVTRDTLHEQCCRECQNRKRKGRRHRARVRKCLAQTEAFIRAYLARQTHGTHG